MSSGHLRESTASGWEAKDRKRKNLIRLGVEKGMAYAWNERNELFREDVQWTSNEVNR